MAPAYRPRKRSSKSVPCPPTTTDVVAILLTPAEAGSLHQRIASSIMCRGKREIRKRNSVPHDVVFCPKPLDFRARYDSLDSDSAVATVASSDNSQSRATEHPVHHARIDRGQTRRLRISICCTPTNLGRRSPSASTQSSRTSCRFERSSSKRTDCLRSGKGRSATGARRHQNTSSRSSSRARSFRRADGFPPSHILS